MSDKPVSSQVSKFRKRSVVVEAIRFGGEWSDDATNILSWARSSGYWDADSAMLKIITPEGAMTVRKGDWVIKNALSEFYPCNPDIFAANYEAAFTDLSAADFSDALMWLKEGKRVQRAGWNGKGQYVILIPGDHLARSAGYGFGECIGEFTFGSVLALKNAQNVMQPGWVPSMGDLLASDWLVVTE